jgi:hypothetical protein
LDIGERPTEPYPGLSNDGSEGCGNNEERAKNNRIAPRGPIAAQSTFVAAQPRGTPQKGLAAIVNSLILGVNEIVA